MELCFAQIYTYRRYTDKLLDVFSWLLAAILAELHEEPKRKDRVTEKRVCRKTCVRDISFLAAPRH